MSELCRHFNSAHGCRFGNSCRFRHERAVCRFFNTPQGCWHGVTCRFVHQQPDSQVPPSTLDTAVHQPTREQQSTSREASNLNATIDAVGSLKISSHGVASNSVSSKSAVGNDISGRCSDSRAVKSAGDGTGAGATSAAKAANKTNQKKKTGKKNGRSDAACGRKEIEVSEIQVIKCGECSVVFNTGPTNTENWTALRSHYVEMFGRDNQQHMKFFRDNSAALAIGTMCGVCGSPFTRPSDLFRHLANKSHTTNVNDLTSLSHKSFFEAIALPFVERDIGLVTSSSQMLNHLRLMLSGDFTGDSDDDIDSDDSDIGMSAMGMAFMIQHVLSRSRQKTARGRRGQRGGRGRGRGRGGSGPGNALVPYFRGSADLDSDSDDGGMLGFSASDVEELMCQGIKPWDDCAWDALAVLSGYGDYY